MKVPLCCGHALAVEDNYPTNWTLLDKFATFHSNLARIRHIRRKSIHASRSGRAISSGSSNRFGCAVAMQPGAGIHVEIVGLLSYDRNLSRLAAAVARSLLLQ